MGFFDSLLELKTDGFQKTFVDGALEGLFTEDAGGQFGVGVQFGDGLFHHASTISVIDSLFKQKTLIANQIELLKSHFSTKHINLCALIYKKYFAK